RMVDQGYRRVYLVRRLSEKPVPNDLDWPGVGYQIQRRRESRRTLPYAPPVPLPDANGIGSITVRRNDGTTEDVVVAVTAVNELFTEVTSTTHDWTFAIATASIPQSQLSPGFLDQIDQFQTDPYRRLDVMRMLMRAGLLFAAEALLDRVEQDFPELRDDDGDLRQELIAEQGRQILEDLERRRSAGQHRLSETAARAYAGKRLPPEVLVRAQQIVNDYEDMDRRIASLRLRLPAALGRIEDDEVRQRGEEMVRGVAGELNRNTVDRLAAFELFSTVDDTAPETLIAMAVSGWLMGGEHSIENLTETWGLFRARQLLRDYMSTDGQNSARRFEIVDQLGQLEGVTIERLALLLQHLPPFQLISVAAVDGPGPPFGLFQLPADDKQAGCLGMVPPEYSEDREYPLVVVFPPRGIAPESVLRDWWLGEACRRGYIVVVPELYDIEAVEYDASAAAHSRFLQLMRSLRLSLRIDDDRVFCAGHGMGAEAAVDMALSHGDQFAGFISIAGLGRKHLNWAAGNLPTVPGYFVAGDQQPQWRDRLESLIRHLTVQSPVRTYRDITVCIYPARGFDRYGSEAPDVFDWMAPRQRERNPRELEVKVMRSTDTSWGWLQLRTIDERFCSLDMPTTWADAPDSGLTQKASIRSGNSFLFPSLPAGGLLLISPDLPDIDLQESISINVGGRRRSLYYQPEIGDLMSQLYLTGDRKRLCYMRIELDR
ncbi:MAG: hypothetical protein KDA85_01475, partial [Planctomycetaceae bacterium]|nr:hypothetical protein [Planctomycetaceae bacterium]